MIRRRRRLPSLVKLATAAVILAALAAVFSPRITAATPLKAGIQVPALVPVSLTFSQPMDAVSVESRLTLDPYTEGTFRWEGRTMVFQPASPWAPGTEVTVILQAGARSRSFLPLLRRYTFSFTVGSPRIAYLWPDDGPADIYARTLDSSDTTRLTESPLGILDFQISPSRSSLTYAALRDDGGSDLMLYDLTTGSETLLYSCEGPGICTRPMLSPDGLSMVFEVNHRRTERSTETGTSQEILVFSLETRTVEPVGTARHALSSPSWSINGELALYDQTLQTVSIVDPRLGSDASALRLIPATVDTRAEWLPDGSGLLLPQVNFTDTTNDLVGVENIPQFNSHIVYYDLESGIVIDLSGDREGLVEDSTPVYSPSGQTIAFTRRFLEPERWTLGRQIWVMTADAAEKHVLVDEPDFNHASLVWSPDSSRLVYTRFNQADLSDPVEIWIVDLDNAETRLLVAGGYGPPWIP